MDSIVICQMNYRDNGRSTIKTTKDNLLGYIDMTDCTDFTDECEAAWLVEFPSHGMPIVRELKFHGAWHDHSDPLFIKVTDMKGEIIACGHGTDH